MNNVTTVDEAIISRKSVRAFLPTKIPNDEINAILTAAARAPSGTNTQPWKVYVTTGAKKQALSDVVLSAHNKPGFQGQHTYKYYPDKFPEPFLSRRRKIGWDMYSLLGIERGEHEKMHAQHGRNYTFFDAPVGLIFTIDKRLEIGSWLDYGMFLQNIMIAARGRGLDTCPQAAFAQFHEVIRPVLNMPDDELLVCGMALGQADPDAIINTLESERAALDDFVVYAED